MAQGLSRTEYRGLVITCNPATPAMKVIRPEGNGTVKKELRGLYTSVAEAKKQIDLVLNARKKNAKANQAAGDEQVRQGPDNGAESAQSGT